MTNLTASLLILLLLASVSPTHAQEMIPQGGAQTATKARAKTLTRRPDERRPDDQFTIQM